MAECLFQSDLAEVWHGDSLDPSCVSSVMGERTADAIICDPPFSAVTHDGHRAGKLTADRAAAYAARGAGHRKRERAYNARRAAQGESGRNDIDYPAWTGDDVRKFGEAWHERCSGWWVVITDDQLAPLFDLEMEFHGLLPFAPLPLVETGSRVRLSGDGPACWSCFIVVARPRTKEFFSWGSLRGAYIVSGEREQNTTLGTDRITGGKPISAMIQIVEDYSRPNDLVCDPVCGAGTTLLAALRTGRRCLGIEKDRGRAELSAQRVAAELQMSDRRILATGQRALFG